MSKYIRKTKDIWEIQTNYGYGWDCETTEESMKAATEQAKCYRENSCGRYATRIVKKRERIEQA